MSDATRATTPTDTDDTAAVSVRNLTKEYGDIRALDGVSFRIVPGEVFGIVGPNGAGKSSTLQTLATLLSPTSGSVSVFGADVTDDPQAVRRRLRYLPEQAGAYGNFTGRRYLEFVAGVYDADDAAVERGVKIADLGDRLTDQIETYSKGMTRKLLIASTLMTRPKVAVLDEPTDGLDVRNAEAVRNEIASFPDDDSAVVVSSHDMLEVEYVCDRVALLDSGRIVAVGTPEALTTEFGSDTLEEAFLEVTDE